MESVHSSVRLISLDSEVYVAEIPVSLAERRAPDAAGGSDQPVRSCCHLGSERDTSESASDRRVAALAVDAQLRSAVSSAGLSQATRRAS